MANEEAKHPAATAVTLIDHMARRTFDRDRPADRRTPNFEFCVHGRPVSAQARNRERLGIWQQQVRAAALVTWPAEQRGYITEVYLRITHYASRRIADMDNLVKLIQDALQGVCYPNDDKVDHTGNWRDINGSFRVRHMSLPLAEAFSNGQEFVHIRLWLAEDEKDLG